MKAGKNDPGKDCANPMWGGTFAAGPAELMQRINASVRFDQRLYAQDIAGSVAHARMLARQGILRQSEAEEIEKGLIAIGQRIAKGEFEFREDLEDVHMNVEAALAEVTEAAGRLHTARSRNDQVATDFRLWVRDACDEADEALQDVQRALLRRAEEHADTIMPGFTHLQPAQPVTLGHHLLAYVEMFGRDRGRFAGARHRMNECPLGAAALAGTSFPIDRDMTAQALGFDRPMANSLDAVSARDFALEFLAACAIAATHLSRLAEELVLWSSAQFGFIRFSDAYSTGSSIMPQKRNPDAAELVRGKTGRVLGALMALLTVVKGLPLAYNKDMQEDKEPVFDAADQLMVCLAVAEGMIGDMAVQKARMRAAAEEGYLTATDLADWLVRVPRIPFRQAHHITGRIVRAAMEEGKRLDALTLAQMQAVEPRITQDVFSVLPVESALASRTSFGGTAPENVRKAVAAARKRYL